MLDDLAGVLNSMSITFLETTPTVLALLDPKQVPSLNTVYSSGEPLTSAVRDKFQASEVGRELRLGNGGAPTETTVMSAFTLIHPEDDPRIIGRPFGGNRLYVLDGDRRLCPAGAVGELYIAGTQVSKGYLGRADLTSKVYLPEVLNPEGGKMYRTGDLCSWLPDGRLLHLGRADSQVKIRGQRIETGEIESILIAFPDIKTASVVKRSYANREELVAFIQVEVSQVYVSILPSNSVAGFRC